MTPQYSDITELQKKHPIEHIKAFATLTPEQETSILSLMEERNFRKGEIISGAVNFTSSSFYIRQGSARTYVTTGGKEHTHSFTFANEYIFVSPSLLKFQPDTVSIQFLEPTSAIFIPIQRIKELLLDSSANIESTSAMLFYTTALQHYISLLEERLYVMQTLSAPKRYQWVLNRQPRIHEIASTTQLASYLGVTKETLYRIRNNKYLPSGD